MLLLSFALLLLSSVGVPLGFPVSGPARGPFCLGLRAACEETRLRSLVGASRLRFSVQVLRAPFQPSGASSTTNSRTASPLQQWCAHLLRPPSLGCVFSFAEFARAPRRRFAVRNSSARNSSGNSVWHPLEEVCVARSAAAPFFRNFWAASTAVGATFVLAFRGPFGGHSVWHCGAVKAPREQSVD